SPFHSSNPGSRYYNLSSYTRSSSTDSLRREFNEANLPSLPRPHQWTDIGAPMMQRGGSDGSDSSSSGSIVAARVPTQSPAPVPGFNSQYYLGNPAQNR